MLKKMTNEIPLNPPFSKGENFVLPLLFQRRGRGRFCILFFIFWFFAIPVKAQHFTSNSYIIDWGNFNITSGKKTSTTYKLTDTVGQNAPGPYTSTGYIVKSGFQYIYDSFNKFSFRIDNLSIALGTLAPGIGTTATNNLTVSTPSGHGYQILAFENHPLWVDSTIYVPDTTCDVGSTCTETTSGTWNNASTYGFGFNVIGTNASSVATGVGTSSIFTDNTYFRQFANVYASETPQVVMSETSPVQNHTARVTYKANISSIQAAGDYQNAITFVAVPNY
jgi:hypothetical protein